MSFYAGSQPTKPSWVFSWTSQYFPTRKGHWEVVGWPLPRLWVGPRCCVGQYQALNNPGVFLHGCCVGCVQLSSLLSALRHFQGLSQTCAILTIPGCKSATPTSPIHHAFISIPHLPPHLLQTSQHQKVQCDAALVLLLVLVGRGSPGSGLPSI